MSTAVGVRTTWGEAPPSEAMLALASAPLMDISLSLMPRG